MRIRPATVDDHDAYLRLFPRLAVPDAPLDRARFESELVPSTFFACDDDGAPLGYVYFQLMGSECYVRHLIVDEHAEGRGVGRALMDFVRAHARAHGLSRWRLTVKPENTRAIALYTACGMREIGRGKVVRLMGWPRLAPLVLDTVRARIVVRDVAPHEDVVFERAFALVAGQLAAARAVGGREVVVALDDEQPVGFALFSPSFPGAFPFRARDLAVTDAILAFLAARTTSAPEGRPFVQLVVEDAPELARTLLERGAVPVLETCTYSGPLFA